MAKVGIIGGSGLYKVDGIKNLKEVSVVTPFGKPSGKYRVGILEGHEVVFLPRHDVGHRLNPSEINYKANIYGMKKLGVDRIISVTACGSLRGDYKPMDFVLPDQFVDRTNQARKMTFFENGIVAHVSLADPFCKDFMTYIHGVIKKLGINVHLGGTYLNMEGPAFSTKAESNLYRSWGMDIIGMTNMSEAKLAREAEICYVTVAAITDFDCWYSSEEVVSADMVVQNLMKNVEKSKLIIREIFKNMPSEKKCDCCNALKFSIVTDPKVITPKIKKDLKVIIGKYVK